MLSFFSFKRNDYFFAERIWPRGLSWKVLSKVIGLFYLYMLLSVFIKFHSVHIWVYLLFILYMWLMFVHLSFELNFFSSHFSSKPVEHNFILTQFYFPTRCNYCSKKVWHHPSIHSLIQFPISQSSHFHISYCLIIHSFCL